MQGDDALLPLASYGMLLAVIAAALLAVALAWGAALFIALRSSARKSPAGQSAAAAPAIADIAALKAKALKEIDEIDASYHARRLSYSGLYQQLSVIVRGFVRQASGVDVTTMTLEQLDAATELGRLPKLIQTYYPSEFSGEENIADAQLAVRRAKALVTEWI